MYNWRKMSPEQRSLAVEARQSKRHPWHSPPHRYLEGKRSYLLSAACFDHEPIIGLSEERLDSFTERIHAVCVPYSDQIYAWCILPNHYHFLLQTSHLKELLEAIGLFHGRTSHDWNDEDKQAGRQVWFNCFDREMRSYRHLMASINYVHNNPVRHGYVSRWQDWPWSSARRFLEELGRERAAEIWKDYPVKDYGAGWDDP